MTIVNLFLNIVLLSALTFTPVKSNSIKTGTKLQDSVIQKNNVLVLIKGLKDYDLVVSSITKEDYESAEKKGTTRLLNTTTIPTEVTTTDSCYKVTTKNKTIERCLTYDEQLISLSYVGFIDTLNMCVVNENWFESTTSNILINLEDGSSSYIYGYELILSPDAKFIYSYANDGIDFDGMSLHQVIDNKAHPIIITDYSTVENYNFDFSGFGKAYWVSNNSFYVSNSNAYYSIKIQDKQTTLSNELKENIMFCENDKFTIKVDSLTNGDLRYTCWNKPNTTKNTPDLVLYNGKVEKQNKYGVGYDYRFENGEYLYVIENNTETTSSKRVMFRVCKDDEEILYTSLKDLKSIKNKE